MKLVVLGLSLSSSWGNGHATTFRALLKAFARRGHDVLFLERDVPWYANQRDLTDPDWCRLDFYADLDGLAVWRDEIASADAVIVGSYVPEGVAVAERVQDWARGVKAFYDIDTPVTLAKLERGDFEYVSPAVIPGFDLYLSFTGGPTLRHIEATYGVPRARALYCSVDLDLYGPRDVPMRWDLSYLGTYSDDRQPTLDRLLLEPARQRPDLRFVVAGPQYPATIDWPANVERIEHCPPADHAAFYSSSRFTLNVTRADMIRAGWSPSVRLFEAGACATPIISDRWAGIDSLFQPGTEIVLADTTADVLAALDQDAAAMGRAARARIEAAHSADHRAAELEAYLTAPTGPATGARGGAEPQPSVTPNHRRAETMSKQTRIRAVADPASQPRLNVVAGGAGFIGSHLCRALLDRGEAVLCLDNLQTSRPSNLQMLQGSPRFEFLRHDITEPLPASVLAETGRIHRVWNLACAASPPLYQRDPEHTMLTNVVGTNTLLRLAEAAGARFLLTSTSEVYGDPEIHPQHEDYRGNVSCTGPRACYDEGKRAAESLAFDYGRAGRAAVRVARIFNTYGPNMDPKDGRVVSNLICQALRGDELTIYGDGSQTRSFCYVSDLVAGLMALMDAEFDGMEPVNLGNPIELTVNDLVDKVLALAVKPPRVVHKPIPVDDPRRRRPDISRAAALLGWAPAVPLSEGLSATWDWFAAELDADRMAEQDAASGLAARMPVEAAGGLMVKDRI